MHPDRLDEVDPATHGGTNDPETLDFSANVNPSVPDGTATVYRESLADSRRYPSEGYPDFREAAGAHVDCKPDRIAPTAGGSAAIRLAVACTVTAGDTVLIPQPSFAEYARETRLQGGHPRFVPHDELLNASVAPHALAICCTPNNPTGEAADPDRLRSFAARCCSTGTTLLVDEAFLGFTSLPSIAGREGVIVARSLTKLFGLPGLRAGFAVASGPLLERLRNASPPWPLGVPAARVGTHCLTDRQFVSETRNRIATERERMRDRLQSRFEVHPSDAPFLLLNVGRDPASLVDHCRDQGIAIRDATSFQGLDSHVRVAIRGPAENDCLLEALDV